MTDQPLCANCGRPLASNARIGGLCPACLLRLAIVQDTGGSFDDDPASTCRVIAVLGGSAHGSSYLAERPTGVGRTLVVLKTIDVAAPLAFVTDAARVRERIAGIANAGVVKMLDAGVTASGQPYFLFDYVRGVSILAHCARHGLDRAARIALADGVSALVDAVHRAGIRHSAIGASNVLVSGSTGEPKLLDAGVRAALDGLLPSNDGDDDDAEGLARLRDAVISGAPAQ